MAAGKVQRVIVNGAVVGGVVFAGWVLMKALSPSKEQMMETLSLNAEEHMASHKKKTAQLYKTLQQNMESSEPVWKVKPLENERKKFEKRNDVN